MFTTFRHETGIHHQGLFMGYGDHLSDRGLVEGDKITVFGVPTGKRLFLIGTVAAEMAKGRVAWEHEQESQEMPEKFLLGFLGFLATNEYTLEQSHDVSPFSIALVNTILEGGHSCGYLSAKTVRSIGVSIACLRHQIESQMLGLLA